MSERPGRWRPRLGWISVAALAVFLTTALLTAGDPGVDRARSIGSQIRCPVCQGESIADSPSQSARDMMDLVRQRIAEGRSDQQIVDELIASYSGTLLLDPPLAGPTLWLWLAPAAFLAVGVAMIARRVSRGDEPLRSGSDPDAVPAGPGGPGPAPSRRRMLVGGVVLGLGMAAALVAVGQFRQARAEEGSLSGVAGGMVDPATVSNETLEAVVAANADNPEITGMRLALAGRYFEAGDYQRAFPHYQAVLEDEPTAGQAATAFTRLGWMVYDGNGEVDLALSLLDQALALVPEDPFALYLKARVVWCGQGQPAAAAAMLGQVASMSGLADEVRRQVEADLTATSAGQACQ